METDAPQNGINESMAPTALRIFSHACNGIFLSYSYTYTAGAQLPTTFTIVSNGLDDLKSWPAFTGFQHNEHLVVTPNAMLADVTSLLAEARNDTIFAGYPSTDLKTAFETAGDMT
ncbi:COBRA-like protein 7 [Camellia lanceoleosa]|uniref:COBRA-like protein 7 n=1 Tax=Camellia lanceoleosa TaxID=1840588 RepID=A0ACC0INQ6_9ERIC|nr:COBRA-like protein 7 [Camellia lanceoleosa]